LSDVYYGDTSSVMLLFEAAGKPVLSQVFEMVLPQFEGLYDNGNFAWFMDCFNMLYRYDKQNKKTEYMGIIPAQYGWACLEIAENNNKLYFAPHYKNDKIFIFDTITKKIEQMDFMDACKYDKNFNRIISFKNFLYFIPQAFPAIMKLNADTKEIKYISEYIDDVSKRQVSKLQYEKWKDIKFWGFCVASAEIALVIHRANAIMFFNMETGNYEIKSIGEKSEQYSNICFDGQNYYISSFYGNYIIKWNRQSNKILKIKIHSFSRKRNTNPNFLIQYLNGYVWLFPCGANNAYKINTKTNEITDLPELTEHFKDKNLNWHYNRISTGGSAIYASTLNKGIVEYNTDTSELNFVEFEFKIEPWLLFWLYDYDNLKKGLKVSAETVNFGKGIWEHLKAVRY